MSNTFKIGDTVALRAAAELSAAQSVAVRDTTVGKPYTLTLVGTWAEDTSVDEPDAICYVDDLGDVITTNYDNFDLVEA